MSAAIRDHRHYYSRAALALFYLLVAILASWPLALHLRTHLPIGSEAPATVALFNLWTLRWNADRLLAGYAGYWQAPIFYPLAGAFALSEPQPATGLMFAPLWLLGGDEVLAYNLVLLLALAANGAAAGRLMTTLGALRGPSLLAGALAVALPFAAYEMGVLQLIMLFPIWLALDALVRFRRRPALGTALALGAALALAFLTCEYYGAFAVVVLGLSALALLPWAGLGRLAAGNLLIGLALAALLLLPVLPAQAQFSAAFARGDATIAQNSAQAADYLRLPPGALGAGLPWLRASGGSGQTLYPGTGLLLLALGGAAAGWRGRRRWVLFALVGCGVALLISFGLNLRLAGWAPYQLLRALVPGFRQLRSPFRAAALLQALLVTLAGLALGGLWRWRAPLGRWLAVALTAGALLEVWVVPAPLYRFPRERMAEPWIGWLATQPPGAVAMAPFPASGAAGDYEPTAVAMLQAFGHRHPLANGYSGFFPPAYLRLREAMLGFPNAASLAELRDAGVVYVVVDRAWASPARQAQLDRLHAELAPLFGGDAASVYRLAARP